MQPDDPQWILMGVLPQAVAVGVATLILTLVLGKLMPKKAAAAIVLGVSAAFVWSWLTILGTPNWPPATERDWLLVAVLPGAMVIGLLSSLSKIETVAWIGRVMLYAVIPYLAVVGSPYLDAESSRGWREAERVLWLGGPAGILLMLRVLMALRGRGDTARHRGLALGVTGIATGALCLMSEAAGTGQLAIALGAGLVAAGVGLLITPSGPVRSRLEDVALPVVGMLMLSGIQFGGVSVRHALILTAGLTAWAAIGVIPILSSLPLIGWLSRWVVMLGLIAWPLAETAIAFSQDQSDDYGY
ncbi:MAG: hypothetical protein RLN76_07945 [Phycisphaeraceae bacterium]